MYKYLQINVLGKYQSISEISFCTDEKSRVGTINWFKEKYSITDIQKSVENVGLIFQTIHFFCKINCLLLFGKTERTNSQLFTAFPTVNQFTISSQDYNKTVDYIRDLDIDNIKNIDKKINNLIVYNFSVHQTLYKIPLNISY